MSDYPPVSSQPHSPPPAANPDDASHLQILAIFYYVFAGLNVFSVLLMAFYGVLMGAVFSAAPDNAPNADMDAAVPMIIGFFVFFTLLCLLFAALHFMVGQRLRQRRGYKFCQIVSIVTCLSIPFGTALGVFTLLVLSRPSVRALFGEQR